MIAVVAGVVRREGRVLLCQRPEGKRFGLLWEFPGGKVEAGESPEAALERELREELDVETRTGRVLDALRLDARGGGDLLLLFYESKDVYKRQTIDMGPSLTLTRQAVTDGGENGIYIHESEKDTLYEGDLSVSCLLYTSHMTFSPMMLRSPRGAMRGLDNVLHLLRWDHFPV